MVLVERLEVAGGYGEVTVTAFVLFLGGDVSIKVVLVPLLF
jgi:hypothetical protein